MASHHPVLPNITDPSLAPIIADDIEQLHKSEQENLSFFQNHKFGIIVAVVIIVVLAVVLYMYMTRDTTPTEKKPQTIDNEDKTLNDIVALRNMRKLKRVQNQSLPLQPQPRPEPQSRPEPQMQSRLEKQGNIENKTREEKERGEREREEKEREEKEREEREREEKEKEREEKEEKEEDENQKSMISNKPDNLEINGDGDDDIDALLMGLADQ